MSDLRMAKDPEEDGIDIGYALGFKTGEQAGMRKVRIVRLPPNPWKEGDERGHNADRRFVVSLYIDNLKAALRKQGLEITEET